MPGLFSKPIHRRRFLQTTIQTLAAGLILTRVSSRAGAATPDERLRLALLSDTHIAADPLNENRKFLPTENLRRAVRQVLETRPHAAIVDGDVARLSGESEDYQAIKGLLEPLANHCPIYLALGNHDDREKFAKVFTQSPTTASKVKDKHVLVLEEPSLRAIVLDSLMYVNKVPGHLGKTQRDWLDKYLASSDARPTVLFVHHTLGEGDGELLDADALFRMVEPYRKVKAIFYGHSHEYVYRQYRGIHLVNLPALGYNFSDAQPVGWVDALFSASGADLTLRVLG